MFSKTRIRKMMKQLEELKAENELLAKESITIEKKLADNTAEIVSIKDDLTELKDISIIEPIIKK